MKEENIRLTKKGLKEYANVRMSKLILNGLREAMDGEFFILLDCLNNPISAMMQHREFPSWTKIEVRVLEDRVDYFLCHLSEPEFVNGSIEDVQSFIDRCTKFHDELDRLAGYLERDDLGAKDGFKCIHDYAVAFSKLYDEQIKPFFKEIVEACAVEGP